MRRAARPGATSVREMSFVSRRSLLITKATPFDVEGRSWGSECNISILFPKREWRLSTACWFRCVSWTASFLSLIIWFIFDHLSFEQSGGIVPRPFMFKVAMLSLAAVRLSFRLLFFRGTIRSVTGVLRGLRSG